MDIFLIRHGHAMNREDWFENDLKRPLTEKGITRVKNSFQRFLKLFPSPGVIITSEAVRAFQTGEIFHKMTDSVLKTDCRLNPGAFFSDYKEVIFENNKAKSIILVGHEPDMSMFISEYIAEGYISIELKKGSLCHIKNRSLINLIQQKNLL